MLCVNVLDTWVARFKRSLCSQIALRPVFLVVSLIVVFVIVLSIKGPLFWFYLWSQLSISDLLYRLSVRNILIFLVIIKQKFTYLHQSQFVLSLSSKQHAVWNVFACCASLPFQRQHDDTVVGLDRYCAGARYPILSSVAIPIPILGCRNFFTESAILCGV